VGAENDQQRPKTLTSGCDDVLRRLGHQLGVSFGGLEQCSLDQLDLGSDRGLEDLISRLFNQHASLVSSARGQRMNSPAC
jgi:hypothetical protein